MSRGRMLPAAMFVASVILCLATFARVAPAATEERAEIKLLVRPDNVAEAMKVPKLAGAKRKTYEIYFVDTVDLKLNQARLILRLRDKGERKTETTVKFRPEDPSRPPSKKWRQKLVREPEWLIGKGKNLSYSLEQELDGTDLLKKPTGNLVKLFSDEQKAFFKDVTKEKFDASKLKVFGPIAAEIWEWKEPAIDSKVSAELWTLGDKQVFELSRKTEPDDLKKKANKFEKAFKDKGIAVDPDPKSKTRLALDYYSKRS